MRSPSIRVPTLVAVVTALSLIAGGCGDTGAGTSVGPSATATSTTGPSATTATTATPTTTSPASTAAPTTTTAPTTTASATTTTAPTTTTTVGPTTTTLPGDPFSGGPAAGDVIAVVGVQFDDVLNVRRVPGGPIVATLAPLADDVVATGRARLLPSSIWWEVRAGATTGWASAAFLGWLGDVTDQTAAIVATLGEIPTADTILDLGMIVADVVASDDPPSRIVVTQEPRGEHDLGEVIIDVIGLGDDSVFGLRLHVFVTPFESGDGFSLKSVEQTVICGRGVSDGLCV